MRLWSLHPKYLDAKGLSSCWREGLLAQKVLMGQTNGYKNHPQLERFKACNDPVAVIGFYLACVHEESVKRGYNYDYEKIRGWSQKDWWQKIPVSLGQMEFEARHLRDKLFRREQYDKHELLERDYLVQWIAPHPMFTVDKNNKNIESWEKI